MENEKQNMMVETSGIDFEGCLRLGCYGCSLGGIGLILGMFIAILSIIVLYDAYFDEYGPVDPDGDYILDYVEQKSSVGTWVIENPYYFVQEGVTVGEMENWRQTKLIISEDGTFELIQPTELLAKLLLVSDFELKNHKPLDVSTKDMENVHCAMDNSIVGQWSKRIDNNSNYFQFQTGEDQFPQCVHIIQVKDDSIKSGRLEEGARLHWSLCSHFILIQGNAWKTFPKMKEGIVWKQLKQ